MKDSVAVEKGAGKAKKSHQHRSYHKNLFLISLSLDIFTQPRKESENPRKPPVQILPQKPLFDIFELRYFHSAQKRARKSKKATSTDPTKKHLFDNFELRYFHLAQKNRKATSTDITTKTSL